MKISLAITALILLLVAPFGWHQRGVVARLRSEQQTLTTEAVALGLVVYNPDTGETHRRRTAAPDRETVAKALAEELMQVINAQPHTRQHPPPRIAVEPIIAINEHLLQLGADQLRTLLETLRQAPGVDNEAAQIVISLTILTLADSHPAAAAAVLLEAGSLLDISHHHAEREIIEKVFGAWAIRDPLAAAAWLKKNDAKFHWVTADLAKDKLFEGTAANDPALAVQIAGELVDLSHGFVISNIAEATQTPKAQSAMLTLLRDRVKTTGEDLHAFGGLGRAIVGQDFEAANTWLPAAKLSPEEAKHLADGLRVARPNADVGRWLEFLGPCLPPGELEATIGVLMAGWTDADYRAAGDWLAATPASATKQAAVVGYVNVMAHFKPALAAQWAETLPTGGNLVELLRLIHAEWRGRDAAAAAAFASKHGLKP